MTTATPRAAAASSERPSGARTLVRGLAVLETVARSPEGIGVTEIALHSELDKGTVSRLLATLRQLGYVQQRDADRRFTLGSRCGWLAQQYQERTAELERAAAPHLARLRDQSQETVHLAVREETFVAFVAEEQPDRQIRVLSSVGTRLPMHRTAMGRALLAALSAPERDELFRELERDAANRSEEFDAARLRSDVNEAIPRGWAAVDRHDEVSRLAAAIRDHAGVPIAAITLSGPSYRVDANVEHFGRLVRETAELVSGDLA